MSDDFDAYYKWLGIPPQEQPPNLYRLLGIPLFEDDPAVIENAADQRMAHLRTFQTGKYSELSQRLLNEVSAARVCLLNQEKKAAYDASLRATQSEAAGPAFQLDLEASPGASGQASSIGKRRSKAGTPQAVLVVGAVLMLAAAAAVLASRGGLQGDVRTALTSAASSPAIETAEERSPKPPPPPPPPGKDTETSPTRRETPKPDKAVVDARRSANPSGSSPEPTVGDSPPAKDANRESDSSGGDNRDATTPTRGVGSKAPIEWISSDATYTSSSVSFGHVPLPCLLTDEGTRHFGDQLAFETYPGSPSHIDIAMARPVTIYGFYIENRRGMGQDRASDLTMWVSLDRQRWRKVWAAQRGEQEWRVDLPKPVHARYVKIGKESTSALHLRTVKFFGQRRLDKLPRLPVPDDDAQTKGMTLVKEVFGEESRAAKTDAEKIALATKLLAQCEKYQDDATTHYLLAKVARDVAIQASDGSVAFNAVDEMAESFEVDGVELKAGVLASLAKKAHQAADHAAIAGRADDLIGTAIKHDRFDVALQLGELALAEAAAARDADLMKVVRTRMKGLREQAAAREEIAKAIATLQEHPADAEANLVAGRYYCLMIDDWERGLPMLAQGSDAELKARAAEDLQTPSSADEQVKLGDGWWELASKAKDAAQNSLRHRAAGWYRQALPELVGLTKARVEKRLQEIPSASADGPGDAGHRDLAETMVGYFQVDVLRRKTKQRTTAVWEFRSDGSVRAKDKRFAEWTAAESQVRIVFSEQGPGELILRPKGRDGLSGTQNSPGGESLVYELQKVSEVAEWRCRWSGGGETRALWSNGRTPTPDSPHTWESKGTKLVFHWANSGTDTCVVSADGKSFKGRNRNGVPMQGELISQP